MGESGKLIPQSGVIPYREGARSVEVLVISSSDGRRWVVPKGLVEPDLTPAESAAKEAWEEAGIRGEVTQPALGEYTYRKWGGTCVVEVFLMRVTEERDAWPEDHRLREWVSIEEAARRVSADGLRELIVRVSEEMGTA
jgi:phosphohistidine phosphatase